MIRNINFQYKYSCCNVSKCIKTSNIHVYLWFLKKLITNAPYSLNFLNFGNFNPPPTLYLQHSSLLTAVALDGSQRSHLSLIRPLELSGPVQSHTLIAMTF